MSYDAESFKAGFALGRLLWRPPTQLYDPLDLGWICDPQFLRYEAGTDLGVNNYAHYVKRYNGWAIAIWEQRDANNGLPILVSTDQDAAYTSADWLYSGTDSGGHTWYIGTGAGEQGTGTNSGDLPVHNGTFGDYRTTEAIDRILSLANVRWVRRSSA